MNKDVQIAEHFTPCKKITITNNDRQKFIEWSSQGKHKEDVKLSHFTDGFNSLVTGKKYAGITMGLWEEGILDGSIPYYTPLIENRPPDYVIEFMKKEMFKGADSKLISVLQSNHVPKRYYCRNGVNVG